MKYIFKTEQYYKKEEIEEIRDNIKKQLESGVVLLNSNVSFIASFAEELHDCGVVVNEKGKY